MPDIHRKHLAKTDLMREKKEVGSNSSTLDALKFRTSNSDCNKKAELNFLILRLSICDHSDIFDEVLVRIDLCGSSNFSLPLYCHHHKFAMGSIHSYCFELLHRKITRPTCLEDCR